MTQFTRPESFKGEVAQLPQDISIIIEWATSGTQKAATDIVSALIPEKLNTHNTTSNQKAISLLEKELKSKQKMLEVWIVTGTKRKVTSKLKGKLEKRITDIKTELTHHQNWKYLYDENHNDIIQEEAQEWALTAKLLKSSTQVDAVEEDWATQTPEFREDEAKINEVPETEDTALHISHTEGSINTTFINNEKDALWAIKEKISIALRDWDQGVLDSLQADFFSFLDECVIISPEKAQEMKKIYIKTQVLRHHKSNYTRGLTPQYSNTSLSRNQLLQAIDTILKTSHFRTGYYKNLISQDIQIVGTNESTAINSKSERNSQLFRQWVLVLLKTAQEIHSYSLEQEDLQQQLQQIAETLQIYLEDNQEHITNKRYISSQLNKTPKSVILDRQLLKRNISTVTGWIGNSQPINVQKSTIIAFMEKNWFLREKNEVSKKISQRGNVVPLNTSFIKRIHIQEPQIPANRKEPLDDQGWKVHDRWNSFLLQNTPAAEGNLTIFSDHSLGQRIKKRFMKVFSWMKKPQEHAVGKVESWEVKTSKKAA